MKLKPRTTTLNPRALLYRRYINLQDSKNLETVYKTIDNKLWLFDKEKLDFDEVVEVPDSSTIVNVGSNTYKYDKYFFHYDYNPLILKYLWQKSEENYIEKHYIVDNYHATNSYIEWSTPALLDGVGDTIRLTNNQDHALTISLLWIGIGNKRKAYIMSDDDPVVLNVGETIELNKVAENELTGNYIGIKAKADIGVGEQTQGNLIIQYNKSLTDYLSARFANIGNYQTNKYLYVGSFDYVLKGSISGSTTQYLKGNIIPITSLNIQYFNDYINIQPDDLVVIKNRLFSVENPETDHKHQPKDYSVYNVTLNSIL